MDVLNNVIKQSLSNELTVLKTSNKNKISEVSNSLSLTEQLMQYHIEHIGPISEEELKAFNSMSSTIITEQIALNMKDKFNQTSFPSIQLKPLGTSHEELIKQSEKAREKWHDNVLNLASNNDLHINKDEFGKLLKNKTITKWANTTADNFFRNIIKQDPNYENVDTKLRYSGYVRDDRNTGKQDYDYQILALDEQMRSMCGMIFDPDGWVTIAGDLSILNEKTLKYKINGNTVYIYDPKYKDWLLAGQQDDYAMRFKFNTAMQSNVFDPYKGAGLLRSLFLDIRGIKRDVEDKYKKQKDYEDSTNAKLDTIQTVLDWIGLIPGIGDAVDIFNAFWYWERGKRFEAVLSGIAVVPFVGSMIKIGVKNSFKAFKIGGRSGIDALEYIFKATKKEWKQWFLDYVKRNKEARQKILEFAKNIPTMVRKLPVALKKLGSIFLGIVGFKWVGRALRAFADGGAKELTKWADELGTEVSTIIRHADDYENIAIVAGKTEVKAVEEVGKVYGKTLFKTLKVALGKGSGMLMKFMYKTMSRKFIDALGRSMVESFVKYIKKGGGTKKFFAAVASTEGGIKILLNAAQNFVPKRVIIIHVLSRIKSGGSALAQTVFGPDFIKANKGKLIDNLTDSEISTMFALIMRKLRDTDPAKVFEAFESFILAPLSQKGAIKELDKLIDNVIVELIQSGNAMWKIWQNNFWNVFKAAAPGRILKYAESSLKIGDYIKYDFAQPGLTNLTGPVGKWLSNFQSIPKIAIAPITMLTKFIDGLTNLKRLDVYYNEVRDFMEKTGQTPPQVKDGESIDEKQGVVVSAMAYTFGTAPFEWIEDALNITKNVANPAEYGITLQPGDYPFVDSQKFKTPYAVKPSNK